MPEPRKRGRPSGTAAGRKAVANTSLTEEVVVIGIQTVFGALELLRGPHWTLNDEQAKAIAEPARKILARQEARNPKAFERAEEFAEYSQLAINLAIILRVPLTAEVQKLTPTKRTVTNATDNSPTNIASNGTGRVRTGEYSDINNIL